MILVDTSAWVEYLRGTNSQTHHHLRLLIERNETIATTEVIVMEVLAGARDDDHQLQLRRLMLRCTLLPTEGLSDFEEAAGLYRRCRAKGATIRSLIDCIIAVVAIRTGSEILHTDRDFDLIAKHSLLVAASSD